MKICTQIEKGERSINFNKLNDPINTVNIFFLNFQFNDTVLHYAVFHNKSEICKFLIEKGANPFQQNKVF